jgi:hypothetical protein
LAISSAPFLWITNKPGEIVKTVTYGFNSLLFFIFLTLKLCNIIEWSWWWVFAPFWIPVLLLVLLLAVLGAMCMRKDITDDSEDTKAP